jgi:hypothetical protein
MRGLQIQNIISAKTTEERGKEGEWEARRKVGVR